jgi:hypothetical protein
MYGPGFWYTAGDLEGFDQFQYVVQDRAFNFSEAAGTVRVEVTPRNDPPTATCQGFPESQFGDTGIQEAMFSQDLYETNAQVTCF